MTVDQYFKAESNILLNSRKTIQSKDFSIIHIIAKGAFAELRLVRKKDNNNLLCHKSNA